MYSDGEVLLNFPWKLYYLLSASFWFPVSSKLMCGALSTVTLPPASRKVNLRLHSHTFLAQHWQSDEEDLGSLRQCELQPVKLHSPSLGNTGLFPGNSLRQTIAILFPGPRLLQPGDCRGGWGRAEGRQLPPHRQHRHHRRQDCWEDFHSQGQTGLVRWWCSL